MPRTGDVRNRASAEKHHPQVPVVARLTVAPRGYSPTT